jgi:hypothetical protein
VTDRELEAMKALADILKKDWQQTKDRMFDIYLRACLISKGYTPEETDKAIDYFLRD